MLWCCVYVCVYGDSEYVHSMGLSVCCVSVSCVYMFTCVMCVYGSALGVSVMGDRVSDMLCWYVLLVGVVGVDCRWWS